MTRKWTDDDTAELKRLHAAGYSLGAVHRETRWSVGTLSKRARGIGLSWEGRMPTESQLAQQERNERIREDVLEAMWGQAASIFARLSQPQFQDLIRVDGGGEGAADLPFIPSRSLDALARAASTLAKAASQIEQARSGTQDASDLRVFLTYLSGTVEGATSDISSSEGGSDASGSNEGVHVQPGGTPGGVPPRGSDQSA